MIDNGKYCSNNSDVEQEFYIQSNIMIENQNTSYIVYIGILILLNMLISLAILFLRKNKEKNIVID